MKDSCYKYLKVGHKSPDCLRNKVCVHCKANNEHHRRKFPVKINPESVHVTEEIDVTENKCVFEDEICLFQVNQN